MRERSFDVAVFSGNFIEPNSQLPLNEIVNIHSETGDNSAESGRTVWFGGKKDIGLGSQPKNYRGKFSGDQGLKRDQKRTKVSGHMISLNMQKRQKGYYLNININK